MFQNYNIFHYYINWRTKTWNLLQKSSVSFYPEDCKKVLGVLGSKSGRDMDKIHDSGLTAKELPQSVTFEEAEVTFVCRKLFGQRLEKENMVPEVAKQFYDGDALHDMYIGEVVEILR